MGAFGGVVGLAGIATLLAAFFSMLVAGAVLIGADEVRQAIRGLIPSASVVPRRDKIKGQSDD